MTDRPVTGCEGALRDAAGAWQDEGRSRHRRRHRGGARGRPPRHEIGRATRPGRPRRAAPASAIAVGPSVRFAVVPLEPQRAAEATSASTPSKRRRWLGSMVRRRRVRASLRRCSRAALTRLEGGSSALGRMQMPGRCYRIAPALLGARCVVPLPRLVRLINPRARANLCGQGTRPASRKDMSLIGDELRLGRPAAGAATRQGKRIEAERRRNGLLHGGDAFR